MEVQTEDLVQVTEKKIQTDDPPRHITLSQQTDKTDSKNIQLQMGSATFDMQECNLQTDDLEDFVSVASQVFTEEIVIIAPSVVEESVELPKKVTKGMPIKPKFGLLISTGDDGEQKDEVPR